MSLEIMHSLCTRFGLKMSLEKTKTMVMTDKLANDDEYPKSICTLDEFSLENVRTFTYLGQIFHYNQPYTSTKELLKRKYNAINSYHTEETFYKNHSITRRMIFDSLVRSKLTYACQTWSTTATPLKTLSSVYCRQLRNLVKGGTSRKLTPLDKNLPLDDEEQKFDMAYKLTNKQIYIYSGAISLLDFVYRQQLKWFSHIIRSPNSRYLKKLTFTDENNSRRGQPLLTLERAVYRRYVNDKTEIRKACFGRNLQTLVESCLL